MMESSIPDTVKMVAISDYTKQSIERLPSKKKVLSLDQIGQNLRECEQIGVKQ